MPQADTQVKIGFGGSLVVMTVLFAYGVYGIAVRDGRGIAIGFGGAIASGVFAALLLAQQRHRER